MQLMLVFCSDCSVVALRMIANVSLLNPIAVRTLSISDHAATHPEMNSVDVAGR
jgi:hypothetical protein